MSACAIRPIRRRYLISRSIAPESVIASDILALDLDSQTVHPEDEGKLLYRERFIHGEIYKVRPDVNSVVHSHSPTVVPFTVTRGEAAAAAAQCRLPRPRRAAVRDPQVQPARPPT